MRIFNELKTQELNKNELDFELGYLKSEKLFIAHHEAVEAVKELGHYETIKEYPNGGQDVKWVVDVSGIKAKEAYDEYEDIQVYVPYTQEEIKNNLRIRRENECFTVINRGELWYETLTDAQREELKEWYKVWLNVTETLVVPETPQWLRSNL